MGWGFSFYGWYILRYSWRNLDLYYQYSDSVLTHDVPLLEYDKHCATEYKIREKKLK